MTQPAVHHASPAAPSQVSALIAWIRRLPDAGVHRAGPAEPAAFHHARHDLLARIQHRDHAPATTPGESVD